MCLLIAVLGFVSLFPNFFFFFLILIPMLIYFREYCGAGKSKWLHLYQPQGTSMLDKGVLVVRGKSQYYV